MTSFSIGRLEDGTDLLVDLDRLVASRMFVRADSGGGKTRTVRRVLEQTHGHIQQLVIDTEGELVTLREKFDYVLAAAEGGDTVAHPKTAALLAERLMELGVSAIMDISDLGIEERVGFVANFFTALIEAPRRLWGARLVILDEAHAFCPKSEQLDSSNPVKNLSALGRKRGLCPVYATQRVQKLHNDAVAELKNIMVGSATLDTDISRTADSLGFPKSRHHEFSELPPGTFFARGPALSVKGVARVLVGPVVTSHPEPGQRIGLAPPPPTSAIRALLPQLADLPAEAEGRERASEDLRRENDDLRRQVTELQRRPAPEPERIPFIPMGVENSLKKARVALGQAEVRLAEEARLLAKAGAFVEDQIARTIARLDEPAPPIVATGTVSSTDLAKATKNAQVVHESPPTRHAARGHVAGCDRYTQDVLDALAKFEALGLVDVDQRQAAALAGKSTTSSTWDLKLAAMRKSALVAGTGRLRLTDLGRRHAHHVTAPRPGELVEAFKRTVLDEYQGRLLDVLIQRRGQAIDRDALARYAGVSSNSSTFELKLSPMRTLGVVEYPERGKVQVSESLFVGEPS